MQLSQKGTWKRSNRL